MFREEDRHGRPQLRADERGPAEGDGGDGVAIFLIFFSRGKKKKTRGA